MEAIQVQEVIPKQEAPKKLQLRSTHKDYEQQSTTHEMTILPQAGSSPVSMGITSLGFTLVAGCLLFAIKCIRKG